MIQFIIDWAWNKFKDNPTAFNLAVAIKASLCLPSNSSKQSTADMCTESANDVQIVKVVDGSSAIIQFTSRK